MFAPKILRQDFPYAILVIIRHLFEDMAGIQELWYHQEDEKPKNVELSLTTNEEVKISCFNFTWQNTQKYAEIRVDVKNVLHSAKVILEFIAYHFF